MLAKNDTVIMKFFLHISRTSSGRRCAGTSRQSEKALEVSDGRTSKSGNSGTDYMEAYEEAIEKNIDGIRAVARRSVERQVVSQLRDRVDLVKRLEALKMKLPVIELKDVVFRSDVRRRDAAVHEERRSVHVRRLVARQEQRRIRDLFGTSESSGRNVNHRLLTAYRIDSSSARSGVSTGPGQSAFARMFLRANSTAISRVIARTPPLLAVYAICGAAAPMTATNDAVLMTDPPPARSSAGIAYLQPRNTPLRLMSMTRSQMSSVVLVTESSSVKDSGVVEDDIDPTECLFPEGDHRFRVFGLRNVSRKGAGVPSDLLRHGLGSILLEVDHDDLRPFASEEECRRFTDTAGSTGDHSHFVLKSHVHACSK